MRFLTAFVEGVVRPPKQDYRWITGLILAGYLLILFISEYFLGDYRVLWRYLGVPAYKGGLFHDLKVITYAMDCLRSGRDPLMDGSCTPGISFNYPTSWYIFQYTGLQSTHTLGLALTLIVVFYASVFSFMGKSSPQKALLYGIILVSPPFMLVVERCNNDLVFFILLFLSLRLLQGKIASRLGGYALLLGSALLKIHPVFAFAVAIKEPKKFRIQIVLSLIILFLGYTLSHIPELQQSSKITPRPYDLYAFGSNVLSYHFFQRFLDTPEILNIIKLISWSITGLIFGIILWVSLKRKTAETSGPDGFRMDAFRLGACMFLGNFVLGNNYDYRLIFLMFCLPQVLLWISGPGSLRRISIIFLILLILLLHYTSLFRPIIPEEAKIWSKAVLYWGLAGICVYMTGISLPVMRIIERFSRPFSAKPQ